MRKIYCLSLVLIYALSTLQSHAQVSHLVISQVYGGGGNSGALYTNDFIEIFNPTNSSVSLTGWSVQYASATGTSWQTTALSGSISPGQYYLIQEAAGATASTALPTPDATGGINMSATAGKVALVNSTTALTGSGCPFGVTIIDFVGFGSTANCFEGSGPTPAPSNTISVLRAGNGCTDGGNNSSDFATGAPNPRNTASPTNLCSPGSTVSVSAGTTMAEPATNGTFNLTLSSPAPVGGVTVNYTLSGTATLNTDYTDPQSGSITIAQGNSSGTITLNVIDDAIVEGTETIILTLNSATNGYTASGNATINLLDNDVAPPSTISLTGIYTQDFNTLASTGSSSTTPTGWLFSESGTSANNNGSYAAGNGSGNAGDTYSFGTTSNTERAFGGLLSGTFNTITGAAITNNTSNTITSLKIIYTGEQWRLGATGRTDRLDFQYSTNATSLTTGTWVNVDLLDFNAPNSTGIVGALDGNAVANRSLISFAITGLSIPNGATFYIRWTDFDAAGADDGLGIDNFSIEANPADPNPPVITSLFPANGSTNVSTNGTAIINFNESVQKGTGNIVIKKTSDNSVVQTIDVTTAAVTVSTTTVSFNLSGLAQNTGYYIEIGNGAFKDLANNNFEGISGNSTWAFTTGNIFYSANFQTCSSSLTDGFTQYSVTGAIVWACTTFGRDPAAPAGAAPFPNAVQINGFANGTNVPNIDWLISPSFDLTGTTFPLVSFWSRTAFNGLPLLLKVSTDYISGNPTLATWTDINGKFPGQTSNIWTLSSNINLSAFKQSNVHFAFVYTSTDEDGARWTLDDISITNSPTPPPPSLTVSTTDIQYTYVASGSTANKTFTFTANDITGGVTLNSTGAFSLSKDGTVFSSSLTYTVVEANNITKTVYVRFAPTQNNQNYTGTVTVATSELSVSVNLKGTSIDPATTLEVVNWNLEWFGSTTFGPTNDNQQEQNVKTILQNIRADIYGLVEVVDTARLGNVVRTMPGYSYIICNYGSHINPPDPSGGPISEAQKEAFVYKTSMFTNITTRPLINNQDINSTSYNSWSSGRYPFLMTADVTLNCVTKRINFVLIHAKANTSPTATSYARREAGANELHDSLMTYFPEANVIVLGDFNDDLDQSITAGFTITSYHAFTTDNANFFSPTLALSLAGKKSTVSFNDMIDHVMLTNDIAPYYMPSSANVLTDVSALVTNYGSTTTDHYPVFTRYQFEAPPPPVITSCPTVPAFCTSNSGTYTIPSFTATSVCGVVNYNYVISGVTVRSGNTNNASGSFNLGTSTITWTATDGIGNTSTCQTTVVVNANPTVSIPDAYALGSGVLANTVYIGYAPASSITLTSNVSGGTPLYSYSWTSGSLTASTTVSPTTNTTYTLTVTDANSCHGTASKNITVMDIRAGQKNDKVIICHKSNTQVVDPNAVPAHLAHGDMLGTCQASNSSITRNSPRETENSIHAKLTITALPNPSANFFTINMAGGNTSEKLSLRVTDILGRTIEQRNNLQSNTTLKIGNDYRPGVYIVEIIQGINRKQLKLIKAGN